MFEFGAHGEDDGTKGVAGDANGIGGLFGMTPLEVAVATAAIAGLDVELRDDGYDRRQVGLKLGDRVTVIQRRRTSGALAERHVDDTIRLGRGTHCGGMARLSTRFLTAFLQVATAKAIGLTRLLPGGRLQIPPQASVLGFQLGQACLELLDQGVTLTTARTTTDLCCRTGLLAPVGLRALQVEGALGTEWCAAADRSVCLTSPSYSCNRTSFSVSVAWSYSLKGGLGRLARKRYSSVRERCAKEPSLEWLFA